MVTGPSYSRSLSDSESTDSGPRTVIVTRARAVTEMSAGRGQIQVQLCPIMAGYMIWFNMLIVWCVFSSLYAFNSTFNHPSWWSSWSVTVMTVAAESRRRPVLCQWHSGCHDSTWKFEVKPIIFLLFFLLWHTDQTRTIPHQQTQVLLIPINSY